MFKLIFSILIAVVLIQAVVGTGPCSSNYFNKKGKCGHAAHGFLRCEHGFTCSQHGYCGSGPDYETNAVCPNEKRPNPDKQKLKRTPEEKNAFERFWSWTTEFLHKKDTDSYWQATKIYSQELKDKYNYGDDYGYGK